MKRVVLLILVSGLIVFHGLPLLAQEGMGYIVERIELKGAGKTKPEVIFRSLAFREGDRLTPERITASREALYRTGLFRTVHVAPKPGTQEGQAVVMVYVDEKRFGDVGVSVEYTELDGFGLSTDAYHVNLMGEGKTLGGEYGFGERFKYWGFSYTDPWFFGSDFSLHVKVTSSSADRDLYRNPEAAARGRYDLERTGGSLGIGQPMGSAYHVILRYSFEEVTVGEYKEPTVVTDGGFFADEVGAAVGQERVAFIGLDFHRRNTGRPWGSSPGLDLGIQVWYSAFYLGSTGDFLKLRGELYRHVQTVPGQIFSIGGRAGAILGSPPFYERFFLDGPNQLRGFERRQIGPEGGKHFLAAEGLYSISFGSLGRAYVFVESAIVRRPVNGTVRRESDGTVGVGLLLFNRIDISFGIGTGTLIVKSHRFGGIGVGL